MLLSCTFVETPVPSTSVLMREHVFLKPTKDRISQR